MTVDFSKFDKQVDIEGLKNDVKAVQENTLEYKEVPHDTYEVAITKLELAVSKSGNPMLTCWMKILEGEYKNSMVFMNQVVTTGMGIHFANKFLRDLTEGMDIDVTFESYAQYAELILDISEKIDGAREYLLEYGENKGFNTFTIKEVFEIE